MNKHKNTSLAILMDRYYRREASPEEIDALMPLLDKASDEEIMALLASHFQEYDEEQAIFPESREAFLWENVCHGADLRFAAPVRKLSRRKLYFRYVSVAAAVAILITFGLGLFGPFDYLNQWKAGSHDEIGRSSGTDGLTGQDIDPGGFRALLTLSDGRQVELSERHGGIVVGDDLRYDDGSLLIEQTKTTFTKMQLATPRGGTYQVTLSDGTQVWLNAGSILRYPSRFAAGEDRIVELEGEAYFEVARQVDHRGERTAFQVRTEGQLLEVLGTRFNLSAYPDEGDTRTTLLEGRVRLRDRIGSLELHPGEQAVLNSNPSPQTGLHLTKQKVSMKGAVAWKDGRFEFEGKSLEVIMRELARWYDIDIRYEGPIPPVEFYGDAYRDASLSFTLNILKSAGLEYRLEGRTLTIWNKKV